MSKLSEKCKELKNGEIKISKMQWENIATKCAEAILDLEFDVVSYDDKFAVLAIRKPVKEHLIANVKIALSARTTPYEVWVSADNHTHEELAAGKSESAVYAAQSNLSTKDEEVDIGELKFYLERTCKKEEKKVEPPKATTAKSKLNEEIDNGFKNNRGRAPLGGETLENDIAFNDYLHRKFGHLV